MDKTVYFSMTKDVTHGRGYIYSLQYHIVWVTKYRKPIFVGEIEKDVRNYLLETLKSLDMVPIAMEIMPDHVHLLLEVDPQYSKMVISGTSGDKEKTLGWTSLEPIIFCCYSK